MKKQIVGRTRLSLKMTGHTPKRAAAATTPLERALMSIKSFENR